MTSQAEPVVGADLPAAAVLHHALIAFDAVVAYPFHVQRTPAAKWAILHNRLEFYALNHGYNAQAEFYGEFNLRWNRADPGDKIQTFTKLKNLLKKVQDVKKYLESPNDLKMAMDQMEELDYSNSDHIESFIETIYDSISLDITILGKHGGF
ncbi:Hypothetical protein PENO1_095890 [Penicillium occitanis (nom. inval.)]|nr:Hypothetical protein PENO1_095890 [Penicillium occitanis (nom. inval.)]PCG91434.1 hypothetical protein PENOC_097360 [Penicillium occitanis (nom. inval.)]